MTRALSHYHFGLLFYITFVYFSNIPGYLSQPGYSSYISFIPTVFYGYYFMAIVLASLVGFAVQSPPDAVKSVFNSKVLVWCTAYGFITVGWYVFVAGDTEVLVQRLTLLAYLVTYVLLCNGDDHVRASARWAMLLAVLVAVANNVYDFMNPFYFTPMNDLYSNPGRAAGFYINANRAGAALIVGAVFTVTLISEKFRVPYILLVGLGVVLTFSRMATIAWAILVVILLIQRKFAVWKITLGGVCAVATMVVAIPVMSYYESLGSDSRANVAGRVEWLASMGQAADDDSMEERRAVSSAAVAMIRERPLLGNGVGSTTNWQEPLGAHNIYLTNMAEHGVIVGIVIVPLLVLASIWGAQGEVRQIAVCFGAMILFIGFFSHNVLEEHHYLLGFALMGSMASRARSEWQSVSAPPTPQRALVGAAANSGDLVRETNGRLVTFVPSLIGLSSSPSGIVPGTAASERRRFTPSQRPR